MQTSDGKRDGEPMNAYEFAVDELEAAEEPMSPAKLADGYGCSGGHMRSVLCDLVRDGEAERIAHGRYIEGDGPESKERGIQAGETAQDAPNQAASTDISPDASGSDFGSISPGVALVVATVLLAVVVIASTPAPASEPEPSEDSDTVTGWE